MTRAEARSAAVFAALAAAHVATVAVLYAATGGREVADDAPHLVRFAREPLVLLRDPAVSGLSATWSSFPPLLPLGFAWLVRPCLELGDFVGIRLGAGAWTLAALAGTAALGSRLGRTDDDRFRALALYAALPLPLLASAVLPQEEAYVSIFALGLVAAGLAGRTALAAALLALTAVAAKVFLLLLAVPLALAGPRPVRTLALFGAAGTAALAAQVGWQLAAFGHAPLLGYRLDPIQGASLWSLLRQVGATSPDLPPLFAVAVAGAAVLAFCALARSRGIGLLAQAGGSLWIGQLLLPVAMPPYLLWNLPFLVYLAPSRGRARLGYAAALFAWVGAAYGAKLCRGVALAQVGPAGGGKSALASLVLRVLGVDFPYHAAQSVLTALGLAIGGALLLYLLRSPVRTGDGVDVRSGKNDLRGVGLAPSIRGGGRIGQESGAP